MNQADKLFKKYNTFNTIWKEAILNIYNNNELLIFYKWIYNEEYDIWIINTTSEITMFLEENNIKVCNRIKDFSDDNYKKFLYTKSDNFIMNKNSKIVDLCIASYAPGHINKHNIQYLDVKPPKKNSRGKEYIPVPTSRNNIYNKKIYSKSCNINNDNIRSFPVGIFDRDETQYKIKTRRIRTLKSIRKLINDNYLDNKKTIKNYIYFLQTVIVGKDSKNKNSLYVEVCEKSKTNDLFTHTTNQDTHWEYLNNHLFCLCLSWNTIESPRLWESLYFGCIPIILEYYEPNDFVEKNYNDLPILYIKNIDDLFSKDIMIKKYESIISKMNDYNFDKLKLSYWKNILLK